MPTLYVTEPGAVVRRSAGSLVVTVSRDPDGRGPLPKKTKELIEVEPHRLEMIALVGSAHITSSAIRMCLQEGIAVAWFRRNGDFMGRLVPELSRTADLRLAQFRLVSDDVRSLALARIFIAAKLRSAMAVLASVRSNRTGRPEFSDSIRALRVMLEEVGAVSDKGDLLGFEGNAARHYFAGLSVAFDGGIPFAGRARRPPPDPVNALLSFGYVIVVNALCSLLEARGFDPYLGFLHAVRSGRPSLALDLTEELRHPVVDRFVLRVCNRRELRPEHFKVDEERGGVRLTRDGLKTFFRLWEAFMDRPLAGLHERISPEALMKRQANRLAAHVRGRAQYMPIFPDQAG